MVGMARRGHGVEELIEAGNPANIVGRGTTGAIHETRVVKRRVGGGDILDRYGMPPVVAEVVGEKALTPRSTRIPSLIFFASRVSCT